MIGDVASLPARGQYTAAVLFNESLCREHFKLVLRLASFPPTAPGQFIQLACRPVGDLPDGSVIEWRDDAPVRLGGLELESPLAVLRRPFSLAGRTDTAEGVELEVIHRVVGIGTDWLARLAPGDAVDLIGPLGNRFTPPPLRGLALLVGGGVGIPPMLYLARAWGANHRSIAFCGALTRDLFPLTLRDIDANATVPAERAAEFSNHGVPSVLSTDDGSFGYRGYVTQALDEYLTSNPDRPTTVIYTCGPELMMKRVAAIAASHGIECQVAVERAMACGMGTCQSCCIRLKRDAARDGRAFAGKDWIYKLACTDGPVFKGADLLW